MTQLFLIVNCFKRINLLSQAKVQSMHKLVSLLSGVGLGKGGWVSQLLKVTPKTTLNSYLTPAGKSYHNQ